MLEYYSTLETEVQVSPLSLDIATFPIVLIFQWWKRWILPEGSEGSEGSEGRTANTPPVPAPAKA